MSVSRSDDQLSKGELRLAERIGRELGDPFPYFPKWSLLTASGGSFREFREGMEIVKSEFGKLPTLEVERERKRSGRLGKIRNLAKRALWELKVSRKAGRKEVGV